MARNKKERIEYEPSKYQKAIFDFVENGQGNAVIEAQAGSGKCLGIDTKVIMFNGSVKPVQDIKVGDRLMGDDSKPRTVLSTTKGHGSLRRIVPEKGDSWVCNDVHVLTLDHYSISGGMERVDISIDKLENDDEPLQDYLLIRSGIDFPEKSVPFDPWLYGILIGSMSMGENDMLVANNEGSPVSQKTVIYKKQIFQVKCLNKDIVNKIYKTLPSSYGIEKLDNRDENSQEIFAIMQLCNKETTELSSCDISCIIDIFLRNTRDVRLKFLAGLVDSNNAMSGNAICFCDKSEKFSDDVVYLCRSLGFEAYKYKSAQTHSENPCYNISIKGNLNEIPVLSFTREKTELRQNEHITRTSFKIDRIDDGDYYGFTLDGNGRFLLGDFTVTHNTSTAIKCIDLIPKKKKILLTAFNNSIVKELSEKIKRTSHAEDVDCRTMHSLGFMLLLSNYGKEIDKELNEFKYQSYIYNNINELGGDCYASLRKKEKTKYVDNVKQFIDFGRCYLAESIKDMQFIEEHYSIPTFGNEKEVALGALKWGKENYKTIDFTDMIWLPHALNCKPYGKVYDWIICDESQDVSVAERNLLLRCTKMSTRMLFFGQDIQSIYGFQGADSQSFCELKKLPNTKLLPLSISYRCAKNIVKLANRFSSDMEASDSAADGEVKYNVPIEEISNGDMVLCRVNAPLLQLYCELSKLGIRAYICGKDIGDGLIKAVKKSKEDELNVSLDKRGVFSSMYNDLLNDIDTAMRKNNISFEMAMDDINITQTYDMIQTLEAISEGCNSTESLIEKIKSLFSDNGKDSVILSTIHKAKGLEADNVYICCPSLLPAKSAKTAWEIKQEANLEYVAFTRARKKLGFLSEDKFTMYSLNAQQKASSLRSKKDKLFLLYGGKDRCSVIIPSHKTAQCIIANATKIETKASNSINISASVSTQPRTFSSISSFMKNKGKKKHRNI